MFDPDDKISCIHDLSAHCSIVVMMKKPKLKEDEDGKKVTDVRGNESFVKL